MRQYRETRWVCGQCKKDCHWVWVEDGPGKACDLIRDRCSHGIMQMENKQYNRFECPDGAIFVFDEVPA